jgi:hypothetical protein
MAQQSLLDIDDEQHGSVGIEQHGCRCSGQGPVFDVTRQGAFPPEREYFTKSLCSPSLRKSAARPRLGSNTPPNDTDP